MTDYVQHNLIDVSNGKGVQKTVSKAIGEKNVKKLIKRDTTPTTPDVPYDYGGSGGLARDTTIGGSTVETVNVKPAPKNVLDLTEDNLLDETAADLLFYEIGGVELANLLSFGTVSGLNQKFKVISNIQDLQLEYNPARLLSEQATNDGRVIDFGIRLDNKIPDQDFSNGFFISITDNGDLSMDLVIELLNIENGEELELQIVTSGTIIELS